MDLKEVETQTIDYGNWKAGSPIASTALNAALPVIQGVADFFGLGNAVKGALKSWGVNMPTTAEVQAIINKILAKAKVKNNQQLTKVQNMLANLPPAYSQIAKKAIDRARVKLQSQQQKILDRTTRAEQAEQAAQNLAYDVDNSGLGMQHDKANQALQLAHDAAAIYETKVTE